MATSSVIKGSTVGLGYLFQVRATVTYTDTGRGYRVSAKYYIYVVQSGETFTWNMRTSWSNSAFTLGTTGNSYASTTVDLGTFAYGEKVPLNAWCYYTGANTGNTYTSTLNTTFTLPVPSYKVSYNANGGSGAPAEQKKTAGKNLVLSSVKPTKPNYTFDRWNTRADGSGTNYYSGDTYTKDAALTLYAIYLPYTHTVQFSANGGTGAPDAITKKYDSLSYIPMQTPTRRNYEFVGWDYSPTSTTARYSAGDAYGADQNGGVVTLYAVWKLNVNCYMKIDGNYRSGILYSHDGTRWRRGTVHIKANGEWKQT